MSSSLFFRLIDQIASEYNSAAIRLHKDGEPLLHPEIVKFIDYASSRLHDVLLVTNATLLNEEMSRSILSTNLQSIRFSVDGHYKETFEKVRKQSPKNPYADPNVSIDYESILNNILRFCELKKQLGKTYPKVGVRSTCFKATQSELSEYISYWEKRVDFVNVVSLASWSGGLVSVKEYDFEDRYPCIGLWESMSIGWDGKMVPCCVYVDTTGEGKGILSDLNRISIREAWHSAGIRRLRLAHLDNQLDEVAPFCKRCSDWRFSSAPGHEFWNEKFKDRMRLEASIEHNDLKF